MRLIYLKEGRRYTAESLALCVNAQLSSIGGVSEPRAGEPPIELQVDFFDRFREAVNEDFDRAVVKGKDGVSVFHYVGLYDYVDAKTNVNLTFFFVPKFLDLKANEADESDENTGRREWVASYENLSVWRECYEYFAKHGRDILLRAIDRKAKEDSEVDDQLETAEKKHEGILELAVRVLRDYLENGLYIVRRRELELNGQGEIDWNTTIDTFQPKFKNGRPYYMEVLTEQAYSDEDHYITRLHKCLITHWGRKLEELGLSSVLRVNVPMLSEEELEHLGDAEYQVTQINRELNVQFVTKAREALVLMRELIERASESKALNHESLSFGMTGVEHLWESACATVLGSELDKTIKGCGIAWRDDSTFREYMPKPYWCKWGFSSCDSGSDKSGWRLDFIRTVRADADDKAKAKKLVILDAKYYCVCWNGGNISGQPGMADISKQLFYQMAFKNLIGYNDGDCKPNDGIKLLNAFVFPEVNNQELQEPEMGEMVALRIGTDAACAFKDIKLFTVRMPGVILFEKYANYQDADDWFDTIVGIGDGLKDCDAEDQS